VLGVSQGDALSRTATREISQAQNIVELADAINEWAGSLQMPGCAAALKRLTQFRASPAQRQELLTVLCRLALETLDIRSARELRAAACILSYCEQLRCYNKALIAAYLDALVEWRGLADINAISTALNALSKMALANKRSLPGVSQETLQQSSEKLLGSC
jgi:hypothetical protein